jgi:hypothetical protein
VAEQENLPAGMAVEQGAKVCGARAARQARKRMGVDHSQCMKAAEIVQ